MDLYYYIKASLLIQLYPLYYSLLGNKIGSLISVFIIGSRNSSVYIILRFELCSSFEFQVVLYNHLTNIIYHIL